MGPIDNLGAVEKRHVINLCRESNSSVNQPVAWSLHGLSYRKNLCNSNRFHYSYYILMKFRMSFMLFSLYVCEYAIHTLISSLNYKYYA